MSWELCWRGWWGIRGHRYTPFRGGDDDRHPHSDRCIAFERTSDNPLWQVTLLAIVLALATSTVISVLAVAHGIVPSLCFVPGGGAQMPLEPVMLVSAAGALAGIGVYAWLRRRVQRPIRTFLVVAAVVLLVSFAAPFLLPALTAGQILVLEIMHLIVAVITVGVLVNSARRIELQR